MRYDKAIYFQTVTQGAYDDKTGDYGDLIITEVKRLASVEETSTDPKERRMLGYGDIRQGSKTFHLLNAYNQPFDRIRYDGKLYTVERRLSFRTKQAFICSEIQRRG